VLIKAIVMLHAKSSLLTLALKFYLTHTFSLYALETTKETSGDLQMHLDDEKCVRVLSGWNNCFCLFSFASARFPRRFQFPSLLGLVPRSRQRHKKSRQIKHMYFSGSMVRQFIPVFENSRETTY
jgi:hypothetical protein